MGPGIHPVAAARVWLWSLVRLWVAVIRRHSVRAADLRFTRDEIETYLLELCGFEQGLMIQNIQLATEGALIPPI